MVEVGQRREEGSVVVLSGEELEDGAGHHPQSALTADEQVLEVVAGVVLPKGPQPIEYLTVSEHRLQTQHAVPGRAVPQDVQPSSVGGDGSSYGGRASGTPVHA